MVKTTEHLVTILLMLKDTLNLGEIYFMTFSQVEP